MTIRLHHTDWCEQLHRNVTTSIQVAVEHDIVTCSLNTDGSRYIDDVTTPTLIDVYSRYIDDVRLPINIDVYTLHRHVRLEHVLMCTSTHNRMGSTMTINVYTLHRHVRLPWVLMCTH